MAQDHLAIPGLACLAEQSFSLSGHTDDHFCHQIDAENFGVIQRL